MGHLCGELSFRAELVFVDVVTVEEKREEIEAEESR